MGLVDDSNHPASDRTGERIIATAEVALTFVSLLDRDPIRSYRPRARDARLDVALADERLALSSTLLALMTELTRDRAMATKGWRR